MHIKKLPSALIILLCISGCGLRRKSLQKPPEVFEERPAMQQAVQTDISSKSNLVNQSPLNILTAAPLQQQEKAQTLQAIPSQKATEEPPAFLTSATQRTKPSTTAIGAAQSQPQSYNTTSTSLQKAQPLDEIMVKIDFDNEDLISMINHFAALQHQNIIIPQGADAINQKVTFKLPHEIPLKEVNKYLDTFLELAGYSRVPHGSFYRIVRNDALVTHESLPLYVGIEPAQLPNSDERIRVIYYLTNLRVPDNTQGTDPITVILNDMLTPSRSYLFDGKSNSLVIADKANTLKVALTVLAELDSVGSKEIIRAIPLFNSNAETVAALITTQILAAGEEPGATGPRSDAGRYFASGVRVAPDPRTNSLIVMGREPAVERMQDFIRDIVDVHSEAGSSIIHYYDLQYLDAEKFSQVLQKIVREQISSGQATHEPGAGPQHFFDSPIIVAEKVIAEKIEEKKLTTGVQESVLKGSVYRGGNRLIITATNRDWQRIKQLIADLDKPRLQAIVQVMILDFDVNTNKILGAQTRNPEWMQLPKGFNFQSAQLVQPILDGAINPSDCTYINPTTVAADLLRLLCGGVSAAVSLTNQTDAIGSTIFSFNDTSSETPGIWSFIQWLSRFGETHVLSNPYLVILNHSRGEENLSDIRRLPGPAETGEGGAISRKVEDVEASLKVSVVPRASSVERVNLQVSIVIEQFEGTTTGNRVTRELHTNVNLGNGETLVLGGLSRTQDTETDNETPILGRIPILRILFSKSQKSKRKTNLVILISPTIVEPKIRIGMNEFSKDRAHHAHDLMASGGLLSQLKDPVSYLFFQEDRNDLQQVLDEYLSASKGDFVFDDLRPVTPLSHHCEPPRPVPTKESDELKQVLATEENPLLAVQKIPQERVFNRQ